MHVVVLGGGYAGLTLTRLLERDLPEDVDLTLVDRTPDHLIQTELHRVIRRPELAGEITLPLPALLERATVRVSEVESIDREGRVVSLADGEVSYDIAAVCLGARTADYGLEGVDEHGLPLKRLVDATRIRARVREALEESDGVARLVVGGAGLSGIQVAGELAALVEEYRDETGAPNAGTDETPGDPTVTILEQFDAVAPAFSEGFQRTVERTLEANGVDVRTGVTVERANTDAITLESGETVPADCFVWTGGIEGGDAVDGERATVEADLRLDDRTVALGDAVRVVDATGTAVPASAQSAVREAQTAATNVTRLVEADRAGEDLESVDLERFEFDSPGWVVSVGDDAVAQVGSTVLTGKKAKAIKKSVGVGYRSSIGAYGPLADAASRRVFADD
ncbi:NAD(P)/FAD-dependent oxidoreductase [Natrarchaeobaculum aegyptiacum]|uniref:NADH dehydrogenase n=1 Tax=Natrarchaeobaculum aegyptiacum TaxID=745377 RepID=A0A2Z2HZJ8_9EURY|nr:FAD-dependent oxidoreductase [Natrarchaeobaculum aegyptiacum]ARS91427.1 NADH dehydrogenase [Natrarchaeobaculum aegyptiacum]